MSALNAFKQVEMLRKNRFLTKATTITMNHCTSSINTASRGVHCNGHHMHHNVKYHCLLSTTFVPSRVFSVIVSNNNRKWYLENVTNASKLKLTHYSIRRTASTFLQEATTLRSSSSSRHYFATAPVAVAVISLVMSCYSLSSSPTTSCDSLPVPIFAVSSENDAKRKDVCVTNLEAELIAKSLRDLVDIPYIPNAIEKLVVEQIIKAFISQLQDPLIIPEPIFNKLVAGDLNIPGLEEAILRKINDEIYIPFISKDEQNQFVEAICKLFFHSSDFVTMRRQMIARSVQTVMNHSDTKESKVLLATKLNEYVDVPFISEETEQKVAEQVVELTFKVLETFLPPSVRQVLECSTSPDELLVIRNNVVQRLNEKVDVPWASEDDEQKAFRMIFDSFLDYYGLMSDGTKNPDEELNAVEHEISILRIQLEAHIENSRDKEHMMSSRLHHLEQKRDCLSKEIQGKKQNRIVKYFKNWWRQSKE